MCAVSRTAHVRSVVKLRGSDGVADACRTVTDRRDLFFAVDIGDLMNEAVTLCAFEDLEHFFIADIASPAAVDLVFSHVAHTKAEVTVDLTGAFTAHCLLSAAGARTGGVLVILAQPVADMFYRYRLAFGLDCLFNRHNMHTDAGASRRNHRGNAFQRHLCHQVEEGRKLRMFRNEIIIQHHELRRAGNEDRDIVLKGLFRILTVGFQDTDPAQAVDHLLCLFKRHVIAFRNLFGRIGNSGLLER